MTYSDWLSACTLSVGSLSVTGGVLPLSGLRDWLRTTLGSSEPTAVFTKLSNRPAELVVVVEVTLALHSDGDWKILPLDTATWAYITTYTHWSTVTESICMYIEDVQTTVTLLSYWQILTTQQHQQSAVEPCTGGKMHPTTAPPPRHYPTSTHPHEAKLHHCPTPGTMSGSPHHRPCSNSELTKWVCTTTSERSRRQSKR